MNRRLRLWKARRPHYDRGYGKLYIENALQADEGCDFGFLVKPPPRDGEPMEEGQGSRATDKLPLAF